MASTQPSIGVTRLFVKLALVVIPCCVIAFSIGLFWLAERDAREARDMLATRISNAAAHVTGGSEKYGPQRPSEELLPQEMLAILLADQAVRCVELRAGDTGEIRRKAPNGLGCAGQPFDTSLKIPVPLDSEDTLVVHVSTAAIDAATRYKWEFLTLFLCAGLLVPIASSWVGFHLIIGRPLQQLFRAIRESQETGFPSRIGTRRQDELGIVINAFDDMQDKLNRAAMAQHRALAHLERIYHATPALLCSCDDRGILTSVSDHWVSTIGLSRDEILGKPLENFLDASSIAAYRAGGLANALDETDVQNVPLKLMSKDGRRIDILLSAVVDLDADGQKSMLCAMSDISSLKAAERRLLKLALTDPLTGLPNRRGLIEHLGRVIHRQVATTERAKTAVLFIDLDNFKWINDSYGHEAGDSLLVEVGERLRLCVRVNDFIARLGGDEFAIVCHRLESPEKAEKVADRIIEKLKLPFEHGIAKGHVNASVGIAYLTPDLDGPDSVLRQADLAMYQAKQSGKGCYRTYSREIGEKALTTAVLREQIQQGLEDDDFYLVFQPIVELASETAVGAEALLRLECPKSGLIAPDAFVPVAEETGQIHELGAWVIEQAIESFVALDRGFEASAFYITINLSPHQLNGDLVDTLERAFQRRSETRNRVVLEITETALLQRRGRVVELLQEVRAAGVRIALDDFGTGYSSLSHLHEFPIDILKIDKSLVHGLGIRNSDDSRRQLAMIKATSALANDLGIVVVAEGVEAAISSRILLDSGVHFGQGYLFSPPVPLSRFESWHQGLVDGGSIVQRSAEPKSKRVQA
ncbi:MAG: EAL domain-containing protein [Pseudomonadota bacterium]